MPILIDKKLVFQNVSLLLLDGQSANVTLHNGGTELQAEVFVYNDGGSQSLEVTGGKPNTVSIKFRNWSNPLGMALNEVQRFGTTADNKHELLFLAAIWKVGALSRIEMQFMLGPKNE